MKRETVWRLEASEVDGGLSSFLAALEEQVQKAPLTGRDQLQVEIDVGERFGEPTAAFVIYYERPDTEDELAAKARESLNRKRKIYEQLKQELGL